MRQRRNKVATRAVLPAMADPSGVIGRLSPQLPPRSNAEAPWHTETVAYWQEVWASPMAAEYIPADVPGIVAVFKLIDRFNYGEIELAGEIRLQRQCFGLTPLDRRRLQWEIERVNQAQQRRPPSTPQPKRRGADPRTFLKAVK